MNTEKRIRWGDGGTWCNNCVQKAAYSVGLCEDCKKIANLGCQLCITGVPLQPIDTASGHIVSWEPATAAWIPCSKEDRVKAEDINRRLKLLEPQER